MYATLLIMTRSQHGGAREGAGRKSIFPDKALAKTFPMNFTAEGRLRLDAIVKRTGLSRNSVIACLALQCADLVAFEERAPFPMKSTKPLSIRMPRTAASKLVAAQVRTGHSYSDIGEAMVRWFSDRITFPAPL